MARCTRSGCGKDFDEKYNKDDSCSYHPGAPVFHEGLKSWSCCKDVNKPVLDFESFMKLPGCTTGKHTTEKRAEAPVLPKPASSSAGPITEIPTTMKMSKTSDGREVFTTASLAPTTPSPSTPAPASIPAPPPAEDEDDVLVPVQAGKKCLRLGCGKEFVSDEVSRFGSGEEAVCVYHPSPPIFREGSKGYLCCKRRVLEFDEFLKIAGCKTGKHVFVKKNKIPETGEEFVKCRIDHYQTPTEVQATVYAKQADKARSKVVFEGDKLHLDLFLPGSKRFQKTLHLYGPIDPAASTFQFFGTKIDITLQKQDGKSWNMLEKPADPFALPTGYNVTFGVSGRTGTVGAKTAVLAEENKAA